MIKLIAITALLFQMKACSAPQPVKEVQNPIPTMEIKEVLSEEKINPSGLDTIILAAGCFWCVEAVFQDLKGVYQVKSGYTGGTPGPLNQLSQLSPTGAITRARPTTTTVT